MSDLPSCLECQACCKHNHIHADIGDALREPRIVREADRRSNGWYQLAPRSNARGGYDLACPFLTGHGCAIYKTRPDLCVLFERGGVDCLTMRKLVIEGRATGKREEQEARNGGCKDTAGLLRIAPRPTTGGIL